MTGAQVAGSPGREADGLAASAVKAMQAAGRHAEARERYAQHFATLMPAGSRTLLVAFEYEQAIRDGPPFSVEPDEVQRLYGDFFRVEELERVDIIGESPKFAATGLDALHEVAYLLTRR